MADVLSHKRFQDEEAAYEWVEAHLWPNGPVCPRCQGMDRIRKLEGKSTRIGTYYCNACRKPFTVKIGTVFEDSHIPLRLWLQAIALLCSSKKGISSNQLHRMLGITLKSAWFMSHRIREAMRTGGLAPMGGPGSIVEIDETFIGKKEGVKKLLWSRGAGHKQIALSLVERGGDVRSFRIPNLEVDTIKPIVDANLSKESRLMTDEARRFRKLGKEFAEHQAVDHSREEWSRGECHTNTLEGYFSIFKGA